MAVKRLVAAGIVLLVAGAVVLAAGSGTTSDAVAMALCGVGAVLLVCAAFYAVGNSEDADRAGRR